MLVVGVQLWRKDNLDWPGDCSLKLLATLSVMKDSCTHTLLIVLPVWQDVHWDFAGTTRKVSEVLRKLGFSIAWNLLCSQEWQLLSQLSIRHTDGNLILPNDIFGLTFLWQYKLAHLDLSHKRIDAAVTAAIGEGFSGRRNRFKILDLSNTCFSTEAVRQLVAADWPFLEELYLDANPLIDAEGVLLQARVGWWPKLKRLSLKSSAVAT